MDSVKKYTVQVPRGTPPCSIDDFPAKIKDEDGKDRDFQRSVAGSLRITPGDLGVTKDELKHLRKHHKDLARRLRVVGERAERPTKDEDAPKPKRGRRGQGGGKAVTSRGDETTTKMSTEQSNELAKASEAAPKGKSKGKSK